MLFKGILSVLKRELIAAIWLKSLGMSSSFLGGAFLGPYAMCFSFVARLF